MITHPDVVFYDFYEAYDDPIEADKESYLGKLVNFNTLDKLLTTM